MKLQIYMHKDKLRLVPKYVGANQANKDIILIGNADLIELYEYILHNNKVNSIKIFLSKDMVLKGLKNFKNKLL